MPRGLVAILMFKIGSKINIGETVTKIVRQRVIKKLIVLEGFTQNGCCHVNKRIFYTG